MSLIVLDNAGLAFATHTVLRGLAFSVPRGQTLAVVGESGCGKTVLLKLMIGLLRPTVGKVVFDGKILTDLSEAEQTAQRLRFGFLFQGAALFDSLSVFDNVAFGLRAQGKVGEKEIAPRVRQHLQEVGLPPEVAEKRPAELSGGMKKRVGLARALILAPEVMLYDEPTTGLDPIMSDVIAELIIQTRQRHPVTSVVVTHDMSVVNKAAERVLMLGNLNRLKPDEPQILYDGPAADMTNNPDERVRRFAQGRAGGQLDERP